MNKTIIKVDNLSKSFDVGRGRVDVLKDVNLDIDRGEFVIIFGPSGCGKSTLLNSLVGLEIPTKGKITLNNVDIYEQNQGERTVSRRENFGIIYQQPNWIKSLNVVDNVAFPLCITGHSEKKARKRAQILLELFRLEEFAKNIPTELSGGQQQRVSVTRSLITNPEIIIADEPTGNLDTTSAADLMMVLQSLNQESKRTVIMVTHNPDYEKYATKVVRMEDGKITTVTVRRKVVLDKDFVVKDIISDEGLVI